MGKALLLALTIAFLLFLKAVDLLTPVNLVLFAAFLVLLVLYFRPAQQHRRPEGLDKQPGVDIK